MTLRFRKVQSEFHRTMKIAVIGAGFTGLSAALYLSRKNHPVEIFEKEKTPGGLVQGFKKNTWQWTVEKHYHHWFTNDHYALNLITELGLKKDLLVLSPLTSVYYQNKISPFNSPQDVLSFPRLSFSEKIRCGLVLTYLKILPARLAVKLERFTAYDWLTKYFGLRTFSILWQPLLDGKFGPPPKGFASKVNMAWFWARIKKRTPRLAYLKGGYRRLMEAMEDRIKKSGGRFYLGKPFDKNLIKNYDKVIFTAPSAVFLNIFPSLPSPFRKRLSDIPHLHALNLLLITKDKILPDEYWLNINHSNYPFLAVVAHTNFVDKKYYGNNHLTWIANYLPPGHPYLKMSKEKLFAVYRPYLQQINPHFNFKLKTANYELFFGPFAQPVFGINYSRKKPEFKTPVKNIYLANMDMVYPWDRGTNYAIELGIKVAKIVETESKTY